MSEHRNREENKETYKEDDMRVPCLLYTSDAADE